MHTRVDSVHTCKPKHIYTTHTRTVTHTHPARMRLYLCTYHIPMCTHVHSYLRKTHILAHKHMCLHSAHNPLHTSPCIHGGAHAAHTCICLHTSAHELIYHYAPIAPQMYTHAHTRSTPDHLFYGTVRSTWQAPHLTAATPHHRSSRVLDFAAA